MARLLVAIAVFPWFTTVALLMLLRKEMEVNGRLMRILRRLRGRKEE